MVDKNATGAIARASYPLTEQLLIHLVREGVVSKGAALRIAKAAHAELEAQGNLADRDGARALLQATEDTISKIVT
jgi:hypothetical protein